MQLGTDARATEQHDAQKSCLKEEGGHHLVAHERSEDGSGLVRKHAPVRAELVTHHDTGHYAHAKGHSEDFFPIVKEGEVNLFACPEVQTIEHRHVAGQANREGWKNNMEAHRERKLNPSKRQRI